MKTREAVIQFELYRLLMNAIVSEKQLGAIRYSGVVPEEPASSGSADLVVQAKIDGSLKNIFVIEVKKRTDKGLLVFNSDAREQAKGYAKVLGAPYYAVTDGERLRIFMTQNDEYEENYKFSLDEDSACLLLRGLSDLYDGKAHALPFSPIPSPIDEIKELSTGFTKTLLDLFQELSGKGTITVTQHGQVEYLNVGRHKGIIRLNLSKEPTEVAVDVRLNTLRNALGDKFPKQIKELSGVPGFQWVQEEANSKYNIWRLVKNIITIEPTLNDVREGLRRWLLELDHILSSP